VYRAPHGVPWDEVDEIILLETPDDVLVVPPRELDAWEQRFRAWEGLLNQAHTNVIIHLNPITFCVMRCIATTPQTRLAVRIDQDIRDVVAPEDRPAFMDAIRQLGQYGPLGSAAAAAAAAAAASTRLPLSLRMALLGDPRNGGGPAAGAWAWWQVTFRVYDHRYVMTASSAPPPRLTMPVPPLVPTATASMAPVATAGSAAALPAVGAVVAPALVPAPIAAVPPMSPAATAANLGARPPPSWPEPYLAAQHKAASASELARATDAATRAAPAPRAGRSTVDSVGAAPSAATPQTNAAARPYTQRRQTPAPSHVAEAPAAAEARRGLRRGSTGTRIITSAVIQVAEYRNTNVVHVGGTTAVVSLPPPRPLAEAPSWASTSNLAQLASAPSGATGGWFVSAATAAAGGNAPRRLPGAGGRPRTSTTGPADAPALTPPSLPLPRATAPLHPPAARAPASVFSPAPALVGHAPSGPAAAYFGDGLQPHGGATSTPVSPAFTYLSESMDSPDLSHLVASSPHVNSALARRPHLIAPGGPSAVSGPDATPSPAGELQARLLLEDMFVTLPSAPAPDGDEGGGEPAAMAGAADVDLGTAQFQPCTSYSGLN